ncbi:hypothetical protein [Streptomyces coeruleorubidus]|uniref:hypothetical protein n=1 Tax=Streptomyces coeruleorubidus TaxID=116188 RepID=UPI0033B274E8
MSAETPAPTSTASHLSSLVAALHAATDRDSLARVFAELADEAIALCDEAPTREAWRFWLDLHESCYSDAQRLRQPAQPKKRRWFR